MNIMLTSVESGLTSAWRRFCGDLPNVSIHSGSILDVKCDAVVSPANSFGFMDGGVDALYLRKFGYELQERLRAAIWNFHHGELLVGAAEIVETQNNDIPFMVAAPTMRVPMKLKDSANPYLAARAAFLLVEHGTFKSGPHAGQPIRDHVKTIAFPGLGTGIGGVGANTCARQVRQAIEDVMLRGYTMPGSWAEASERHQLLYTDRVRNLQYDE